MEPATAFGLLGDETRVEILRQLLEAERTDPDEPALSFATLQEQCDIERSNRLSYHLSKLEGVFVTQTDDGTYRFTAAGWGVARSILRGTYAAGDRPVDDVPLDSPCSACDSPLQATDDDGVLVIECSDCGTVHTRYFLPPGVLEPRASGDRAQAVDSVVRREMALAADGVCPGCLGVMDGALARRTSVHARYDCGRCGNVLTEAVTLWLQRHPAVVAFCHDHGVDPTATPHWHDPSGIDHDLRVVVENPLQVQVRFAAPDETLPVTVDHDLAVTLDGVRRPPDNG